MLCLYRYIDRRCLQSQRFLEICELYKCMFRRTNGFPCSFSTSGESRFPVSFFSRAQGHCAPALSTHTHTLQPTVSILCQTCQDTWVSGLLYRQTWGQLWQAWGNTRDQLKSKFSPDLTACLFVCLTGARHITLGTIDYDSEPIVASVSLEVILLEYFLSQLSLPPSFNWQQHELNFISARLAVMPEANLLSGLLLFTSSS